MSDQTALRGIGMSEERPPDGRLSRNALHNRDRCVVAVLAMKAHEIFCFPMLALC